MGGKAIAYSRARELIAILALAATYYLAARLGLSLAFAGTNASPVWPPSGIALAAIAAPRQPRLAWNHARSICLQFRGIRRKWRWRIAHHSDVRLVVASMHRGRASDPSRAAHAHAVH
jgi:hypothetical protein